MPEPRPERTPINDPYKGVIVQNGDTLALAAQVPEDTDVFYQGEMILRYGIAFLERPHIAIVPDLIALDYGDMIVGEEAWDFLLNRSNLYPRADVLGYRHDGIDDMIAVKRLDVMAPIAVLAYRDAEATQPIARLSAFIGNVDDDLPERARAYLHPYESIVEWQATLHAG
ncbi:hypothetical protein G4Y79_17975 [Phototrophicus methaneseepsis]|uniref:Uncharacterized protein n=1 Tax=Phototrophicus methaneseepsis TaxID=2710758 RepID=A0A7S8E768_9CHLR|nr:hypothetical protein [Phototrophicus methaneseepsis]QPC81563.1 hypothetical protein G4Y79_17975 [Phototrophicus methaneseepsis]